MLKLNQLPSLVGKRNKRRGRGYGSNAGGHTVGWGQKGQKSRGRRKRSPVFDGQNTPQYRKMPKYRGFKSLSPQVLEVKSGMINAHYKAGEVVSPATLRTKGLIKNDTQPVKILFNQEITIKVTFENVKMSKRLAEKFETTNSKSVSGKSQISDTKSPKKELKSKPKPKQKAPVAKKTVTKTKKAAK